MTWKTDPRDAGHTSALKNHECPPPASLHPPPHSHHPLQRLFLVTAKDDDVSEKGRVLGLAPSLELGSGESGELEIDMFRNCFKIHFTVKHTH